MSHLQLTVYNVDDNVDLSSLDSLPTPGTSTPVSKGTRGMSFLHTLQLTAYHAVIRFFTHTRNFHACLQGDEGDEFLVSPEKVLFLLSKSAISLLDWPRSGSVWVRALFSQTRTLIIRFGPADWQTQTQNLLNLVQ